MLTELVKAAQLQATQGANVTVFSVTSWSGPVMAVPA